MSPPAIDITFGQFAAAARADGCDEVIERAWKPGTVLETHRHPFRARALVVQGRMWLTEGGHTRELGPGDRFELAAEVPHAERYGPEGATYWVARYGAREG